MSKGYTIDDILALHPCAAYNRTRLATLFGGRGRVSALDIATDDRVPHNDRRWLFARLLDRQQRVMWAAECASAVLPLIRDEARHDTAQAAIQSAIAWAQDPSAANRENAAAAAADAAAWAAAAAAAYAAAAAAAAYADAAAAADAAAYAAADAAAWAAAYAAADAAAWAAADAAADARKRVADWTLLVAAHYLDDDAPWPGDCPGIVVQ